ncbi:MAG: PEGA domain-containing protein [Kofleriaceae bacterium]|nr:PEGA domain-containing protein [Kofleriaceae bacterium]
MPQIRTYSLLLVVLLGLCAWGTMSPSYAETMSPKRKIAILEYRSGSSALPNLANRIAGVMRKTTSLAVLSPDQTRAIIGDGLDESIVTCAGAAECLARIGAKAGVAELVLVGISEFGGVIVTLQRINTRSADVAGRIADSLEAGLTPTDEQLVAYLSRLLPPSDFLQFGIIDIVANIAGASVSVGGQKRGVTPLPALRVDAPATYDVKVEKPGYVPFRATIQVPPDGTVQVKAELARHTQRAWYARWWVLAGAGVIVAGATASIFYATSTDDPSNTVPVTGTID